MRIFATLALIAAALAANDVKPVAPPKEFDARLKAYLELKQKATKGMDEAPVKSDPKTIEARKTAAAQAISDARAATGAKQGDLFTPAAATQITKVIRSEMKGPDGAAAKKEATAGNPASEGTPFTPKVNMLYPANAPLSTVPTTLLLRLPQLPKDIEYRFVGKALILLDADARVILDILPNAQP